ncbi:methyl-accepting chemotaxis protein [Orrella sp. JC864]|uniref:methyl-accepting chemotaxis protein n=1 Tax=Orrella sp. JC864 TaxID=3120298 RepID=UPI00300BD543
MTTSLPPFAFLRNITIRKIVLWALALIGLLVAGLSFLSLNALRAAGDSLHVSHLLLRELSELSRANDRLLQARLQLGLQYDLLEDGAAADAAPLAAEARRNLAQAARHFQAFRTHVSEHQNAEQAAALVRSYEALLSQGIEPLAAHLQNRDLQAYRSHNAQTVATLSAAFGQAMQAYENHADQYAAQSAHAAQSRRQAAEAAILGLLALFVALLVLADRYIVHYVRRPLVTVREHFQRIAAGDLTARIELFGANCVGQLMPYLRDMQASLARTVGQVRRGVNEINAGAAEIASGNNNLSQRTEEQAASLEETAASMEQMASTVRQNAENAAQASQLALGASEVGRQGATAMEQVEATMRQISRSADRIGEIVGVIDSIAFQTNILALNAAVEAARAGQQGKGFAVVASEVRSLAQRSAQAAKEIKALIAESTQSVQAGSRQVATAGDTVRELLASVTRVSDVIGEISAASAEQSIGIEQVNLAVSQMDLNTQQNAALVEQAAAAAVALEEQARMLQHSVEIFKLGQGEVIDVQARLPDGGAGPARAPLPPLPSPA